MPGTLLDINSAIEHTIDNVSQSLQLAQKKYNLAKKCTEWFGELREMWI